MIYGVGNFVNHLARLVVDYGQFPYQIVGLIDDDQNRRGRIVHGLKVVGSGDELAAHCRQRDVDTVILAMPKESPESLRTTISRCVEAGVKPLIMPNITETSAVLKVQAERPRPLDINDLLRRSPRSLDEGVIRNYFYRRVVLVTGAGGSIGSEVSRQVHALGPITLILLDSSEYNLYEIDQKLREANLNGVEIVSILASVCDEQAIDDIMTRYHPSVVLHAAAYKHVPLLEQSPLEAIGNNVSGTQVLARAAIRHDVERFLLISSDKAVNPTNVMGASKRCCELLVQSLYATNKRPGVDCCIVRFGNVLGSSGSVIPRFIEQIRRGGPVTVTHPDMTRYFMLINEAVALVLLSISISRGGELFVLNMGEPVKIVDMARQLILISGKSLKEIKIETTGIRPGEKMFEELFRKDESYESLNSDIYVSRSTVTGPVETLREIERMVVLARQGRREEAVDQLFAIAQHPASSASRATCSIKVVPRQGAIASLHE
jgi:FlaA1/EpsC-like NDP-sugar epimerase